MRQGKNKKENTARNRERAERELLLDDKAGQWHRLCKSASRHALRSISFKISFIKYREAKTT